MKDKTFEDYRDEAIRVHTIAEQIECALPEDESIPILLRALMEVQSDLVKELLKKHRAPKGKQK